MAEMDLVLVVAKLVDEMRKAGPPPSDQDLNRLAAQISNGFKAKKEEVAILRLSTDAQDAEFSLSHQTLGGWEHSPHHHALVGRQDHPRQTR